ncbi:TetR/AcrR family transcriptional regulator [Paraburkholderia saeva]|uniref:TetR/AcrR family transcriptional regulator n=1 Tax=Paraburkholderia saeva TaxID=2777537 RepID=UPI001E53D5F4|nr:TetR/AcrR family transcriptional regulator [Paraburkholderia saeva]
MNAPDQPPARNQIGQSMYRKGLERRQRLADATAELLKTTSLTNLKVIDIARAAGCSKPNFYLYFSDVLDAVLAAVERISMATPEIVRIVEADWPAGKVESSAKKFVSAYLRYRHSERHVLRVRTVLSAEGEPRFKEAERLANAHLLDLLTQKIETHQARYPRLRQVHPASGAAAILATLERLGSYGPIEPNDWNITDKSLIDAVSAMVSNLCEPPA